MTRKLLDNTTRKNQGGQALVEGTVGLVIVIMAAIGALLLLTDTYLANSYKVKLGLISDQTANYLAEANSGQDLNQMAQDKAKQLVTAMELPMDNPHASVVVGNNLLKVTITGKCRILQTGLPLLPLSIDMTDTAAVPAQLAPTWDGWLEGVRNIGQGPSVYMPVKSGASGSVGNVLGSLKCGPGS